MFLRLTILTRMAHPPLGDVIEANAVRRLLGANLMCQCLPLKALQVIYLEQQVRLRLLFLQWL